VSRVRNGNGTFALGNPGGPGRPPRPTERSYLVALAAAVPLEVWGQIVDRAVADALAGDAKAREWLAKYLLGSDPMKLLDLAADEEAGIDEQQAVTLQANKHASAAKLDRLLSSIS